MTVARLTYRTRRRRVTALHTTPKLIAATRLLTADSMHKLPAAVAVVGATILDTDVHPARQGRQNSTSNPPDLSLKRTASFSHHLSRMW